MKKSLISISMAAMFVLPTLASADIFDWSFAGAGISGSGVLTAVPFGGPGEFDITGGSGSVTDATYGTFAVTFLPCATPSTTCTYVNSDGHGGNTTFDNLLFPGNSPGGQLDSNGIDLVPGPPGSGSNAINIFDTPSQEFYNYVSPFGYENLTTPFQVTLVPTPEPSFYGFLTLGLGGLIFALYFRKKQNG